MTTKTVRILSSMASKSVLQALSSQYQAATGHGIALTAIGGVDALKKIQAGDDSDIVILASGAIQTLLTQGHAVAGSRVDLVTSGVSIAVPSAGVHPDVSSEAALREAVLAAATIGYSTGPSGVYLEQLFERWGILDTIRPRFVQAAPGVPVGSLVARGEVALGFQQLSELLHLPGVDVLGPLPPSIQLLTTFCGAIVSKSTQHVVAREILHYFSTPAMAALKKEHGMQAP
jgi:molybdate transport system substrate-binding protein